jgi:hypothetical protein
MSGKPPTTKSGWHKCGAPPCSRRVSSFYFCCGQHRALLGWRLSADLQTAWRERRWRPINYDTTRRLALQAWGWQPEETKRCHSQPTP